MKVKLKLDPQSIKNLVIEHGEKLAFAVVGIVFAMFLWSAAKREVLDSNKQPERLQERANQVRTHVQQSAWDVKHAEKDGLAFVDFAGRAKREPVAAGDFPLPTVLNQPIEDPKTKREDPAVYAIESLRVDSGFGTFALSTGKAAVAGAPAQAGDDAPRFAQRRAGDNAGFQPPPTAKLKPQAWVVVTGLVPLARQAQEYSRVFNGAQAFNLERDQPTYIGYLVERAEIDPAQPDKLNWQPLKPDGKFEAQWQSTLKEVVEDRYTDRALTSELGPLVGRAWGDAVVHPKIPLPVVRRKNEPAAAQAPVAPRKVEAPAAAEPQGRFGRARAPALAPGAVPEGGSTAAATAAAASAANTVEYQLFRVFDFNVMPAKKYRYRVKVALQNPNFNLPPKVLKKPDAKALDYIETEWSEASPLVAIPDRFNVLAKGVTKESRASDPTATIVLSAIDESEGIEAATEIDVQRGSVANVVRDRVQAVDPRDQSIHDLRSVDFHSGRVVVDIRGGKPLSKKSTSTSPVEVLVLDQQGNLRICNELDDQSTARALLAREETSSSSKADPIPSVKSRTPTASKRKDRD